jgi:hypothetical protein
MEEEVRGSKQETGRNGGMRQEYGGIGGQEYGVGRIDFGYGPAYPELGRSFGCAPKEQYVSVHRADFLRFVL